MFVVITGCTTTVQIYTGESRNSDEVAVISRDYDAAGRNIKIDGIDIGTKNAELLPGEYLLSIMYKEDWTLLADGAWTVFPIRVNSGQKYHLHSMSLQVRTQLVEGDDPELRRAKTWERGYIVGKSNYADHLFFWLENKKTAELAGGYRPEPSGGDRIDDYRVKTASGIAAEL